MPSDDFTYYSRLEIGARFLAAQATSLSERDEHLGMARLYARRRADTGSRGIC